MKNMILFSWILLLFTACETGTQYDINTSKESAIVEEIDTKELYDPTHSESYFSDQGEDDYAEEIASVNRELPDVPKAELPDVSKRDVPEEIEVPKEHVAVITQHFEGGTVTDGLDIKSIRKAEHEHYERVVFDSDGSNKLGSYEVDYNPSENFVRVVLNGYRTFSAKFPIFEHSIIVEKIEFAKYLDDSGYKIHINLKEHTKIKVLALDSPARLVIDIQKP